MKQGGEVKGQHGSLPAPLLPAPSSEVPVPRCCRSSLSAALRLDHPQVPADHSPPPLRSQEHNGIADR